jgi:hypothetical protein
VISGYGIDAARSEQGMNHGEVQEIFVTVLLLLVDFNMLPAAIVTTPHLHISANEQSADTPGLARWDDFL